MVKPAESDNLTSHVSYSINPNDTQDMLDLVGLS